MQCLGLDSFTLRNVFEVHLHFACINSSFFKKKFLNGIHEVINIWAVSSLGLLCICFCVYLCTSLLFLSGRYLGVELWHVMLNLCLNF